MAVGILQMELLVDQVAVVEQRVLEQVLEELLQRGKVTLVVVMEDLQGHLLLQVVAVAQELLEQMQHQILLLVMVAMD
jgi:hypothetical protein